jgi:hypothetical protein
LVPFDEAIKGSANRDFLYSESTRDDIAFSFYRSIEDGGRPIVTLQEEGQVATIICKQR